MRRRARRPRCHRHQVVVIGSGFGGLAAVRALRRADVEVTLIARTNHHLFQPLLYQVATGVLSEGEVAPPTRELLARQQNATVLLGEVVDIDVERQTVSSRADGRWTTTRYDSLIVAAGAGQSYFGHEEYAGLAPGLKTVADALELRGRILGAFELAELAARRGEDVAPYLTFVVVGAGPTGVELAGQIAELARRTLRSDFRAVRPQVARVVLVEDAHRVLPTFGPRLGERARRDLEELGVEPLLGTAVTDVDGTGVEIVDTTGRVSRVEAATVVWAAGVEASPLGRVLAEQTDTLLDRAGRVTVNPDLTVADHPELYVVGDLARVDGVPGTAPAAMQAGRYAGTRISRQLAGRRADRPFRYRDRGSVATIGRFRAVATLGRLELVGLPAWLLWMAIHLFYLPRFGNRLTVLWHGAVSVLSGRRAERTISEQQVVARTAIPRVPRPEPGRPEHDVPALRRTA